MVLLPVSHVTGGEFLDLLITWLNKLYCEDKTEFNIRLLEKIEYNDISWYEVVYEVEVNVYYDIVFSYSYSLPKTMLWY